MWSVITGEDRAAVIITWRLSGAFVGGTVTEGESVIVGLGVIIQCGQAVSVVKVFGEIMAMLIWHNRWTRGLRSG